MVFDGKLKILLASAEVAPFAKTGGLADVAGSLPKTLAMLGHDVRIVMPKYRIVDAPDTLLDMPVEIGNRRETTIVRHSVLKASQGEQVKDIPVYFIDNYHYFDRDGIYCHWDDGERFGFFCRAILEMLPRLDFQPDIIHLNDWQSGPVALLLKSEYGKLPFYRKIATLFTIHNLKYQGNFSKDIMEVLKIPDSYFTPSGVEFYGTFSFMKTGLVYADLLNTVSRTYAREIQTPEFGERMDGLLKTRSDELFGIVNGINYQDFNPQNDSHLAGNFDAANWQARKANKPALQQEMGLPVKDVPVLGIVTRLVEQKGLELLEPNLDDLMQQGVQLVVLGEGEERFHNFFTKAATKYPDKVGIRLGFDASLAQRIYAGSDIFLMPSKFEPCGLGQLIALRYGCIPVVRATGGLADTISDYDQLNGAGNGFVFQEYTARAFRDTVNRALQLYRNQPEQWERLVVRALESDFSWQKPAAEYVELYRKASMQKCESGQPADADSVETLQLSKYAGLAEAIRKVRQEGNTEVLFPQAGTKYDGKTILRCNRTIDREYFLMVTEDRDMFYILDDIGLE